MSGYFVSGVFNADQSKIAVGLYREAGNAIVAAIGGEEVSAVGRQNDAAGAFERVGRTRLTADWLEDAGSFTTRRYAPGFFQTAVMHPSVMNDRVRLFIGLHIEVPDACAGILMRGRMRI
nr:hypothetical protein [Paraburkholderia edwinii]